jgi:DNA-binding NarL/FixJ family response regulator
MRVLIVDDNELFLEVAKATLSAAGFEVATSSAALSFTAALADLRPHVALVDVLMPGINGNHLIEIARRQLGQPKSELKRQSAEAVDCAFILHSNLPEADLHALASRCGARGFIRKSMHPRTLVTQLQQFLQREGISHGERPPSQGRR